MPEANLSDQIYVFLYSVLSGALCGAGYSLLKTLRATLGFSNIITVVCDILFMLTFTLITVIFSVGFTDGFVRMYVIIGEILGFFAFVLTLGKFINIIFKGVLLFAHNIKRRIQKFFAVFIKKLLKARDKMLYNIENKSHICMAEQKGER